MNLGLNQQNFLPDIELSPSKGITSTEVVIVILMESVSGWVVGWLVN